jgi:hypothetical protein
MDRGHILKILCGKMMATQRLGMFEYQVEYCLGCSQVGSQRDIVDITNPK